jgi:hypothetical protein
MAKNFAQIVTEILKKYDEDIEINELYHYTDGNSLQSIIETNQLWLTERNYLNDVYDEEYAAMFIKERYGKGINFHGSLYEKLLLSKTPQYVFSTSLENDQIHQWNYYSGSDAYCVEFDRHELINYLYKSKSEHDNFYYGPIIYDPDKAKEIINSVMDEYTQKIETVMLSPVSNVKSQELLNTTKNVYQFFFSLIKQKGHKCEKEFRFLFQTNRLPKFKTKKGLFVPYIEIGKKDKKKIPIKRIIIGPNNHEVIAEKSLRNFLDQHEYKEVKISRSKLSSR